MEQEIINGINKAEAEIERFRAAADEASSLIKQIGKILAKPAYLPESISPTFTDRYITLSAKDGKSRVLTIRAAGGNLILQAEVLNKIEEITTTSIHDDAGVKAFLNAIGEEITYFRQDQDTVPARRARDPFTGESKA